jgi:hypothetical protein
MPPLPTADVEAFQCDGGLVVWGGSKPKNEEWEAQIARLASYKAAHGDCNVPRGWAEDLRLGRWVNDQRQRKRKLDRGEYGGGMTAERAARLTALGFVWDPGQTGLPKPVAWEAQLTRLVAYKVEHGNCNVSREWAEDPRLARWVDKQRMHKRALDRGEPSDGMTAERAAKLTALGFAWTLGQTGAPDEVAWEAQLARLAAYKVEHGDCNVPVHWAKDPRLGKWVSTQRMYKNKLDRCEASYGMTAARAVILDALGFEWNPRRRPSRSRGLAQSPRQAPARHGAAPLAAMAHGTTAAESADQDADSAAAPAGYPPGARVARLFGDGRWYDGTVLEAPWPLGHRWGRWRRVLFDDGETSRGW